MRMSNVPCFAMATFIHPFGTFCTLVQRITAIQLTVVVVVIAACSSDRAKFVVLAGVWCILSRAMRTTTTIVRAKRIACGKQCAES